MKDYTLNKYFELCNQIIINDYNIITVEEYLLEKPSQKTVILRHDVDSKPERTLRLAKLEAEMGIRSTYYFRYTKRVFDPTIIKEVSDMGHEVGYHYEVLTKLNGDYEKAIEIFEYELNEFLNICDIKTISMHGCSLSKYDNRSLWNVYNFEDYGILGEAYLSVGEQFNYFSDTGRSWNPKNKVKDWIPNKSENISINSTDDLINLIQNNRVQVIYLLTHPPIWAGNFYEWYYSWSLNKIYNFIKTVYKTINNI